MPELPEVETIVRDLRPLLVGRSFQTANVGELSLRRKWDVDWNEQLIGRSVVSIQRRGKWITLHFNDGPWLLVHLGMTGQFTVNAAAEPLPDHTHLRFGLSGRADELRFRDVRRFGSFDLFTVRAQLEAFLDARLGPEPFAVDPKYFQKKLSGTVRPLKAALLDQSLIAGVGNIYADEALFAAQLHPSTRANDLTAKQCERLRMAVETVLIKAIEGRGSTIRDYIGGSGLRGTFQNEFTAYGRTGEPCVRCETPIEVLRIAGRSSHFCPKCQVANE